MKPIRTAICIAALALGSAAAARTQAPQLAEEGAGAAAASKLRCAKVEMPGTRIISTRCRTPQGWDMLGVDLTQK